MPEKPPISLLHVVGGLGFGGTERLCLEVVRVAEADRPEIINHLLYLDGTRTEMLAEFQELLDGRIGASRISPVARLRFLLVTLVALWRLRPDAIVLYVFGLPHVLVAAAARLALVRKIVVSAGNPPPGANARSERLSWRRVVQLSRWFGVPIYSESAYIQERLRSLDTALPAGSRVVHNGCAVDRIWARAEATRSKSAPTGGIVIGMVARLDPIKDHATLLRAFKTLSERNPAAELRLRLVGDGPLAAPLEALAHDLGVRARVDFLGWRADTAEQLGDMDVFVFSTTEKEGFGIALIEALAAGVPVICSDVPACREVLGGSGPGVLVPPGDAEALAAAMERLIADAPQRIDLSRRARAFAKKHYDIRSTADAYLDAVTV